jgi:alpha-glucosidase
LLELRARNPVMQDGAHEPLSAASGVVAYLRNGGAQRLLVALNFTHAPTTHGLGEVRGGRVVLSTFLDREGEEVAGQVRLRADEGLVIALEESRVA